MPSNTTTRTCKSHPCVLSAAMHPRMHGHVQLVALIDLVSRSSIYQSLLTRRSALVAGGRSGKRRSTALSGGMARALGFMDNLVCLKTWDPPKSGTIGVLLASLSINLKSETPKQVDFTGGDNLLLTNTVPARVCMRYHRIASHMWRSLKPTNHP